jgi:hypothetical protein
MDPESKQPDEEYSDWKSPETGNGIPKEKIRPIFGHCFEIARFDNGDIIPVGGENIISQEMNIGIVGDFESFKQFYADTHDLTRSYNPDKLKEYLSANGIDIDEKLFATLFAFTKKYEEKYPANPEAAKTRRETLFDSTKNEKTRLSDILGANSAECAEIAALAQGFLQQEGVSSSYFSGDILWKKDEEFSEEHSFIVIRGGEKTYIYDPANPTNTTAGSFPSLYTTEADFDKEMARKQKKFVTAKNIINKNEICYGVNDGTNIIQEKHIV